MTQTNKVAIITGGARRIGAEIAHTLHTADFDILIHYRNSNEAAQYLCDELNSVRKNSCISVQGELDEFSTYPKIIETAMAQFGRIDALINNASSFYPTPINEATQEQWQELMASNLKAPLFLSQQAIPELEKNHGNIINIIDIYANRPLADHPIYCSAKAGLQMLTKSLARDLNGKIRVNGVAPGAILWPENDTTVDPQDELLKRVPMNSLGEPADIAKTILFLLLDAPYINGQIIAVDGGRSVMP